MLLIADIADQSVIVTQTGIGLGSVIAVVCSWDRNHSILWAILADLFVVLRHLLCVDANQVAVFPLRPLEYPPLE